MVTLCVLAACSATTRDVPNGWDVAAPLARAVVRDGSGGLVEIDLVAAPVRWTFAPGRAIDGFAYNGTVPGPLIEARVGDTLVVHFRNDLPEATTIHWHGVRVPAAMDGSPEAQAPVAPGGTFEYRFVLTDAGTFWYHPHVAEPEQMERGLYGAIVVRGHDEPVVDSEAVVMLDDLTLDATGALAPFGGLVEAHGGREGDVQLVNGVEVPNIPARVGERQRLRIINAGSARFYRLTLSGHRFTVIGTDGGATSAPTSMDELFLVPGDRVDVLVDLHELPGPAQLVNQAYSRGHGSGVASPTTVATITPSGLALPALGPYEATRIIDPIDVAGIPARQLRFDESIDAVAETVTFTINGETYPDVTPLPSRVGAVEVLDLINESEMDHPFHLHGFSFQVIERDGVPVAPASWEDTVHLPGLGRARIAFRVDDRPGMWMFHCHILEHIDNGMMGMLHVEP